MAQEEKHHPKKSPTIAGETVKELYLTLKKPMLFLLAAFWIIMLIIPILTYIVFAQDLQDKERIMNRNKSGLTLLDDTGQVFFSFYQPKSITYTPLSEIPRAMQDTVVASEDREFYTHPGFSIRGILRAVRENFLAGDIRQGGSTIPQELVKISLLNSERSFLRKYQELILSIELDRKYSKEDILELYLNSVYFGEGAFGVENAAQAYFGIPAKKLTIAQSALLSGLLPAPSAYSPLSNDPKIAKAKQEQVLNTMVEIEYISQVQADEAKRVPLVYNPQKKEAINQFAPHFALMVKDTLIKEYGEETVIRSGFVVKTTLRKNWQLYAERTVENTVKNLSRNDVSNGAAVAINPKTGEIKALVGSHNWSDENNGKINMVVAPRQPGSSFKPLMYAAALQKHYITPATILEDKPLTFTDGYKPRNYDGRFRGPVTVRRALASSLNIPAIEVMEKIGIPEGISFAKQMGITTLNDPTKYGLSLVLGAAEVPLIDMTSAFSAFANEGKRIVPVTISEIKDKYNKVVYSYTPAPEYALDGTTAFLISSILSDNAARAETFGGSLTISRPAAVKTGTTEDYRDSLTIGYTPNLAIGVWVGNNDNTPMDRIAGSSGAAPIWRSLMNNFLVSLPYETFKKPLGVLEELVCPYKFLSGESATSATSSAYKEFFLPGTEPKNPCEPSPTPTQQPSETPTPEPSNTPAPTQVIPTFPPANTPIPTVIPTPTSVVPAIPTLPPSTPSPTL